MPRSRLFRPALAAVAVAAMLGAVTGAPISAIGVGPGRDQTVEVRSLLG